MANLVLLIAGEHVAHALRRRADARNMRRALQAFGANLEDGFERAFARRAAGAERDRAERRLQIRECSARRAQLLGALDRSGRKELDAAIARSRAHRARHQVLFGISAESSHETML